MDGERGAVVEVMCVLLDHGVRGSVFCEGWEKRSEARFTARWRCRCFCFAMDARAVPIRVVAFCFMGGFVCDYLGGDKEGTGYCGG